MKPCCGSEPNVERCHLHGVGNILLALAGHLDPTLATIVLVVDHDGEHTALCVQGPGLTRERVATLLDAMAVRVRAAGPLPPSTTLV